METEYYKTPEFKRWFAKWYFSGYLALAIAIPFLWMFVLQFINILDLIAILCIQIVCVTEMLYITTYSFEEILKFLKKRLRKKKDSVLFQNRSVKKR